MSGLFFNLSHEKPAIRVIKIYERIYPPVGPKSTLMPPRIPLKTGSPTAPQSIYTKSETVLFLPPRMTADRKIANMLRVIGTGPIDIVITENTAMIAAKSASVIKVFVFIKNPRFI